VLVIPFVIREMPFVDGQGIIKLMRHIPCGFPFHSYSLKIPSTAWGEVKSPSNDFLAKMTFSTTTQERQYYLSESVHELV